MIRRIRGELLSIDSQSVLIDVGGIGYEVEVPEPVREAMSDRGLGSTVELFTYHYLHDEAARITPHLVGFQTETQRDFFQRLLEVPRIGPMAALRAFVLPAGRLARAIEVEDVDVLKSLPGVGPQRARDMIARLKGKLGQFVDVAELPDVELVGPRSDTEADALEVLMQLGLSRADAMHSIIQVTEADPELQATDEIVREVFRQR